MEESQRQTADSRPVYPNVSLTIGESPLKKFSGEHRYFTFNQNNSGGVFDHDENYGDFVIIAAKNDNDANERALSVGIYFDGVDNGSDCSCCGDRWYVAYGEGDDTPLIYGERPEVCLTRGGGLRSVIVIHHADGTRETYHRVRED